ncbi:DUF393 domain-containing protein [bacterium]|nr:DUF393 domain-containing protein [bacterium]
MNELIIHVIYDGECDFCIACKTWAENRISGSDIWFIAYQSDIFPTFSPRVSLEKAKNTLILRYPSGRLVYGAEAVFHTMVQMDGWWDFAGRFLALPPFARVFDTQYQWVVKNRKLFSRIVRLYPAWNTGLYT